MVKNIAWWILFALFTIIVAATLGFIVIQSAPIGDYQPGDSALPGRYLGYIWGALCWDFGTSDLPGAPPLGQAFAGSVGYALMLVCTSLVIGGAIGILSAIKTRRGASLIPRALFLLCLSLPGIVVALPLVIAFNGSAPMILVTVSLCVSLAAFVAKTMLERTLEIMRQDYIKAAYSRGIPIKSIINRYIIPNALPTLIRLFTPVWAVALVITAGFECVFYPVTAGGGGRLFSYAADFYKSGYVSALVGLLLMLTNLTVALQFIMRIAFHITAKSPAKRR